MDKNCAADRNLCSDIKEAVCIETKKIYDSCRDRECLEDLRVYLSAEGQEIIDKAVSVRPRRAEVLWAYIDVEPVSFNRGYYSLDIRYYFRVGFDVYCSASRPVMISGLAVYDKKTVMFGSDGMAKIYSSRYRPSAGDMQYGLKTNMPEASVEVVDPVVLSCKLVELCDSPAVCCEIDMDSLPEIIGCAFDEPLINANTGRRLFVSLGLFSILRLARNMQILIPVYDFCVPDRECESSDAASTCEPCDLFRKFKFPIDEFFPPQLAEFNND